MAGTDPPPAGFPSCGRCFWRRADEPAICLHCAMAGGGDHPIPSCSVCGQALEADGCRNHWCAQADRHFTAAWSLFRLDQSLRWAIWRFKYRGERGWAPVFARLVVGFLDDRMPWFDGYHVIVPMPSYRGEAARRDWDHMGEVARAMPALCGDRWPVATDLLHKVAETPAFAGLSLVERRRCAESSLRRALAVTDPSSVEGTRVLVLDDVFTEGSTLREVARALLLAGAAEVAGLTIARQPWSASALYAGDKSQRGRP